MKTTTTILSNARDILSKVKLATGCYAKRHDNTQCGPHDINVGSLDLAASIWLATNGDDELFNRAWLLVRKHVGWTSFDDKHTNALFCRWLDKHNKEWHLARLDEIINGLPLVVTSQKDHARLVEALKEYA